ncbi:hypothetical protein [Candidatus Nitrospira bockiana]
MVCPRCHGLMVKIDIEDAGGSSYRLSGWHCLLCGNVTETGIQANRKYRQDPRRSRARPHGTE